MGVEVTPQVTQHVICAHVTGVPATALIAERQSSVAQDVPGLPKAWTARLLDQNGLYSPGGAAVPEANSRPRLERHARRLGLQQ